MEETPDGVEMVKKMHRLGKKVFIVFRGDGAFQRSHITRLGPYSFIAGVFEISTQLDYTALNAIGERIGVEFGDMIVIGNSLERDIKPIIKDSRLVKEPLPDRRRVFRTINVIEGESVSTLLFEEGCRCGLRDWDLLWERQKGMPWGEKWIRFHCLERLARALGDRESNW